MKKLKIMCVIFILLIGITSTYSIATDEKVENEKKVEEGQYIIESAINSNKVITIQNGSIQSGANVALYENENLESQKFNITLLEDGYYKITSVLSGKVLDVYAAEKRSGANVDQYAWNGSDAQKWEIRDEGNGYCSFVSKCNGLYLDVYAALDKDGTNIQVYESNGGVAQKFYLRKYEKIHGTNSIEDGRYIIESALDQSKVVSVEKNYNVNCANVELGKNNGLRRQQFDIKYLGEGYYKIESVASQKVLDVYAAGKKNGTNVDQYTWNESDAQKWIIKKDEKSEYYSIVSKCNELYLDIYAGLTTEGNNIQVYKGNGSASQLFAFKKVEQENPVKSIENGIYNIQTAIDTNRYIDVTDGSFEDFGNIQIWSKSNGQRQQFEVEYLENGYYKIQAVHSNKALDVYAAENRNGANVDQYTWNGSDAQKWIIKDVGEGYYSIISKCNDLYLDVYNGINKNGTNIQVYENTGNLSQKFKFVEAENNKEGMLVDGVYSINSAIIGNMNLDVLGGEKGNGANVGIWRANNSLQQRFKITYIKDGYYEIQAMHSGKLLDVYAGLKTSGTNVDQYTKNNSDAQKWYIENVGDGYYTIISKCNGLYLDVYGGISQNGNNVQVYEKNGSLSQKFKFESIYFGIDVSKFQNEIDFDALVKSERIDFMIARAGYYSETQKKFINDQTFERNYTKCKENNIPVGTYIYSYAITVEEAKSEAINLIKYLQDVGANKLDLPIFFDIEDKFQSGLSKEKITDICLAFCETIKQAGYKTGIYANKDWWTNKIDITRLPEDYTIWVAAYGKNDGYIPDEIYQYKGKHDIWQYTSTETIPGIGVNVDMNISYIDWKNQ